MEILKKFSKMMISEILDADKYVQFAEKLKHNYPQWADTILDIAEQELAHKSKLEQLLKDYVDDCDDKETTEKAAAIKAVFEFIQDNDSEMEQPIITRIHSLR